MTVINVIEVEDNSVVALSSYTRDNLQDAEKLFKAIGSKLDPTLDEEDLEDAIGDGIIENKAENKSVCITWSVLDLKQLATS